MRKVTMKDVAREAGVSVATVSYVLNDTKKYKISEETKEKVLKVSQELGFVPNSAAKTLKKQEVSCIGLVILKQFERNLSDRYSKRMMTSIKEKLSEEGYQLMICSGDVDDHGYPDYISYYLERRIGGVIYIVNACQQMTYKELEMIQKYNVPAVIVDAAKDYENVSNLKLDYYTSTMNFLKYLLEKEKFQRILCLCPDEAYQPEKSWEQTNAMQDFAKGKSIPMMLCPVTHVKECDIMDQTSINIGFERWMSVYHQVKNYLQKWREGDLVFCANGFLGDSAMAIANVLKKNIMIAVGEEFQSAPMHWIDYLSKGGRVFIDNMQPHRVGVHAVKMMAERLQTGENQNEVLHARIIDFAEQIPIFNSPIE